MITKITVDYPPMKSYFSESRSGYKTDTFQQAFKDVEELSLVHSKIASLINYNNNYPGTDVTRLIRMFFGEDLPIQVRQLTKKKRVYWIPYLHIYENDKL